MSLFTELDMLDIGVPRCDVDRAIDGLRVLVEVEFDDFRQGQPDEADMVVKLAELSAAFDAAGEDILRRNRVRLPVVSLLRLSAVLMEKAVLDGADVPIAEETEGELGERARRLREALAGAQAGIVIYDQLAAYQRAAVPA